MIRNIAIVLLLAALWTGATAVPAALAQDPLEIAPGIYKLLFENDQVRVCEITIKPGDQIGTHSHPDHLLYVLSPGKIRLNYAEAPEKQIEVKEGETLWMNAETHASANVGDTQIRAILIELKETAK
jgi:quercetin dioxygenase-like cupin family protein